MVKLFNVIQQAQQTGQQAVVDSVATRGTGKATLPAPDADAFGGEDKRKGKGKSKSDNPLGRGKPGQFWRYCVSFLVEAFNNFFKC